MTRIKFTHVPRIALALFALLLFFTTFYYELISRPIDFNDPRWAFAMVAFLFIGVLMLLVSWGVGLHTRAEVLITLFMLGLHISFDGYILLRVFVLKLDIPVFLVQAVVEAYWMAGLVDVLLMFWADNWERTRKDYVSPEKLLADAMQRIAVMEAQHQHDMRMQEAALKQAERQLEASSKDAQRLIEASTKVYTASCEGCGRIFSNATQDKADKAMYGHRPHCKGSVMLNGNGHKQAESAH